SATAASIVTIKISRSVRRNWRVLWKHSGHRASFPSFWASPWNALRQLSQIMPRIVAADYEARESRLVWPSSNADRLPLAHHFPKLLQLFGAGFRQRSRCVCRPAVEIGQCPGRLGNVAYLTAHLPGKLVGCLIGFSRKSLVVGPCFKR